MRAHIVLVDDEANILESLKRILHRDEYEIAGYTNARDAMQYISEKQGNVDVVISDNKMPHMQGVDFLVSLRRKYPDVIRVMLTGQSDIHDAKKAINEGAIYRFLTKPCDPDEIRVVVRHALSHKELWAHNKQLLRQLEAQQEILESLERDHPGITRVTKDHMGVIDLSGTYKESLDDFLKKYLP